MIPIDIVTLPHFEGLTLPRYETEHAAGMDLRAALTQPFVLVPNQRAPIPTGLQIALPPGYEGQVRPRSGLALKKGIGIINSPGTLDADYRGEIFVPLINLGEAPLELLRGMRIAQLVIAPIIQIYWQKVTALDPSSRGKGGFGHTGLQ